MRSLLLILLRFGNIRGWTEWPLTSLVLHGEVCETTLRVRASTVTQGRDSEIGPAEPIMMMYLCAVPLARPGFAASEADPDRARPGELSESQSSTGIPPGSGRVKQRPLPRERQT